MSAIAAVPAAANPTSDQAAIFAAREQSNAGIAAHDAVRATGAHMSDAKIVASGGALIDGAEAMRAAFTVAFKQSDFITFVRTPSAVDVGGSMAAEHGRWVGRWRTREVRGDYLAAWSKIEGRWLIRSEQFVPLSCAGAGCDNQSGLAARSSDR